MSIADEMAAIVKEHGPWSAYNFHLADGVQTAPECAGPHFRLRRTVQIISDMAGKPWKDLRILDLGSLEGIFALEYARQGAEVVGIEGREAANVKARFAANALGISNVTFFTDDARNLTAERYGKFDVVLCSGLLYHLGADDGCAFVNAMASVCTKLLIIDTHVGIRAKSVATFNGKQYHGATSWEHGSKDSRKTKAARPWAALNNNTSFWITEPSLINLLRDVGFTSVSKVLAPNSFSSTSDRMTFAAIKGEPVNIHLSPELAEIADADYPEKSTLKPHPYQASGSRFGHLMMRVKRRLARKHETGAAAYTRINSRG